VLLDAHFGNKDVDSYRAYRLPWTGRPRDRPAIAVAAAGGGTSVYASWNGATEVARWRVLAGDAQDELKPAGEAPKDGFETKLAVDSDAAWFSVQALDATGTVLGTSLPVERG
jgi:hypothetical protein